MPMPKVRRRLFACRTLVVALCLAGRAGYAEDAYRLPSYTDFGDAGLLQMPSGRMMPDGELGISSSHVFPYTRHSINFQALPWAQAGFRYTRTENRDYARFQGTAATDKALDLRLKLLEEDARTPAMALVLRDLGGTNLFGSEFIVLSKRWYDFDFTAGMAWGNAGTRNHMENPLTLLSDKFRSRRVGGGGYGGMLSTDFFRGQGVSFIGGLEYQTPIEGLRFKIEYDGNSYQEEPAKNNLDVTLPINAGFEYRPFPWLNVRLGAERGNTFMLGASLQTNFNKKIALPKQETSPPKLTPREHGLPVEKLPPPPKLADDGSPMTVEQLYEDLRLYDVHVVEVTQVGGQLIASLDLGRSKPTAYDLATASVTISRSGLFGMLDHVVFRPLGTTGDSDVVLPIVDVERSVAVAGSPLAIIEPVEAPWLDSPFSEPVAGEPQPAPPVEPVPATAQTQEAVASRVFADLAAISFQGHSLRVVGQRARLHFSQKLYRQSARGFGRAARILARHLPEHVEELQLVVVEGDLPAAGLSITRSSLERAVANNGSAEEIWASARTVEDLSVESGATVNDKTRPEFSWSLTPKLRQHMGGGDTFYAYQLWMRLSGEMTLWKGFGVSGSIGQAVVGNFDELVDKEWTKSSALPHVRSDIVRYLQGADTWLDELHADQVAHLGGDWYGRASAGLFEMMYGGVGGEVLYRPRGSSWALGVDVNHVWQRGYDGHFTFKDYDVTTGHLTWYQDLPFYDLRLTTRAGRYLAKDVGVTFDLSRQFENGAIAGVFASKTNVSAAEFGEGSFDKGFYVSFPLDLLLREPSRKYITFPFRPLTRDGGQQLAIPKALYPTVKDAEATLKNAWWEITK